MNQIIKSSVATLLALIATAGCKKIAENLKNPKLPPPVTGTAEQLDPQIQISLDASLTQKERDYLKEDLKFANALKFRQGTSSYAEFAFGQSGGNGILKYLDERIGHIIGPDASIDSRFSYTANTASDETKAVTIATNIGMAVWLETIAQRRNISFFTNNSSVAVNDPRIGIIKLGRAYSVFNEVTGRPLNTVARTSVLVHEARHSDCTGGLSNQDFQRLSAGELPENRSCGHLHTICESGDYKGLAACDGREWGAYALGWLFAQQVSENCETCNEAMRQTAQVVAIDSLGRIPIELVKKMRSGTLAPPDMSSTTPQF